MFCWPRAAKFPRVMVATHMTVVSCARGTLASTLPGPAAPSTPKWKKRSAGVNVRGPHVERHGGDLVSEAREHEHEAEEERRPARGIEGSHAARDTGVVHGPGEAEDPAHAVDHRPRGDAAVDEILERGLARAAVVPEAPGQPVRGGANELEREVRHEEGRGRRHEEHREAGREEERVVLALVRLAAHLTRAGRHPDDGEKRQAEEHLEEHAETVE